MGIPKMAFLAIKNNACGEPPDSTCQRGVAFLVVEPSKITFFI